MAEFFLAIHFLFILFLIFGWLIGLYCNHRKFRLVHASLLAIVILLMVLEIPCPLTSFEEWALGISYEGSFIATWLNRIIYLAWFDPITVFWMDIAFGVLVFSSFLWLPLKR